MLRVLSIVYVCVLFFMKASSSDALRVQSNVRIAPSSVLRLKASNSIRPARVMASTLLIASTLTLGGGLQGAMAAVGEGDLPDGSMAFSKLLKYQKDWKSLADSVKDRASEIDEKETISIKFFLKQLANEYYDMELLAKGMPEEAKATEAKALAKDFRAKIRECDDAASAGNLGKIAENYPATAKELQDFFSLMQDVPDEL